MELVSIFIAGLVGSFFSAMSAGGGALIIEPWLLIIGVEPAVAIGSTKIGAFGTMLSASSRFHKAGYLKWRLIWPFLIIAVVASVLGPLASTSLSSGTMELLIIIMATVSLGFMILRKEMGKTEITHIDYSRKRTWAGLALYFVGTFLLAGLGSGIGIINSLILVSLIGFSFLQTTAIRRAIGLVGLPIQAAAFAARGSVSWPIGFTLLAAMSTGSYIGTSLAIKRGNSFVRRITITLSALLLITLIVQRW